VLDIFGGGHLGGFTVGFFVLPEVLESVGWWLRELLFIFLCVFAWGRGLDILVCGLHLWTALWAAELGDRAIQQVDLVVEVDALTLR